jgi:acyl carrier protein
MSIKSTIISHIGRIAEEQKNNLAPLTDDLPLLESGLDSLGIAILVARLEETLGFDPFSLSEDIYYPVTLGEFIRFYEEVAKSREVASGKTG